MGVGVGVGVDVCEIVGGWVIGCVGVSEGVGACLRMCAAALLGPKGHSTPDQCLLASFDTCQSMSFSCPIDQAGMRPMTALARLLLCSPSHSDYHSSVLLQFKPF